MFFIRTKLTKKVSYYEMLSLLLIILRGMVKKKT